MRISRITATAILTLAATGLASGVVHAEPAPAPPAQVSPVDDSPLDLRGSFKEVAYQVAVAEDRKSTITTLENGRFALVADSKVVTVTDNAGQIIAALPMTIDVEGHKIDLRPVIEEAGTRLSLAPNSPSDAPVRDISSQERFFADIERYQPQILQGAAIGAVIGFLVGFPLGLFVFDVITVPITTVVGGVIGAFAGLYQAGGQESVDAAIAYLTGQP
ncbi:hypothetical protein [Nocardia sp. XZ_19_385]|uniref:hypothetical protein n=1 Tax=Nocardia sp. XZ_19_385 TaxID=2769488 RepID=UPI00188FE132|nr:hypothetical protein [Nocardia sp. XZ_19_385]